LTDAAGNPNAEGGSGWFINHLPSAVWQRRRLVVGTTLFFLVASLIAAFALPTIYRSKAVLLVQSQELPSNIVEAPVSGAVGQRLAKIRERVLSRGDLITLIEQNELYPNERRTKPLSAVVKKMREATMVSALAGDLGEPTSGQEKTIAITMSFDYPDPAKAQAVLQSFVTSFISIDSDDVEDQANLSVRFLEDQARKLQGEISQIEGQITGIKARNGSALASSGMPGTIDTGSYSAQIANLENQNRQLLTTNRRPQKDPQLASAEIALATAQAQYSDRHPDVVQAQERLRQMRQLTRGDGADNDSAMIQEQIRSNNAAVASLMQQRSAALARASSAMAGSARAPAILEQAMQLESRASALREQYKGIAIDLLQAQNGARMAGEQRAERLTLVDAPDLPDSPKSPNRPLLVGGGLAAGLLIGLFFALAAEFVTKPLRSPAQLEALGLPVLGLVPVLGAVKPPRRSWLPKRRERRTAPAFN